MTPESSPSTWFASRRTSIIEPGFREDPGPGLRVLRHHVLDELRHVEERAHELEGGLDRDIDRADLRSVVRVLDDPVEPEALRHRLTVEGPGRAVQHRGPHRAEVEARPELAEPLEIAPEPLEVTEPGVPEAVRLRRDPVRVAGGDCVAVLERELLERLPDPGERPHRAEQPVAEDRALEGRMHVLGRAPGVDQRDVDPGFLHEERLVADVHQGARVSGRVPLFNHALLGTGPDGSALPVEKPLPRVHDEGGLVDLGEPEELVARGLPGPGPEISLAAGVAG